VELIILVLSVNGVYATIKKGRIHKYMSTDKIFFAKQMAYIMYGLLVRYLSII
jgi:hypothetical protein